MPAPRTQRSDSARASQEATLRRSLAWMRAGRLDLALRSLRKLAGERPADPFILVSLATAVLRTGNAGEALVLFNSLLKSDPCNTQALMGRGLSLHKTGDLTAALDTFRRLVATDPLCWRAWQSIADITPHEDERVHAIEGAADALLVLSQSGDAPQTLSGSLIAALLEARMAARALQVLSARPAATPEDASFLRLKARSLYQAGKYEAAFTEATRLLRAMPTQPRPHRLSPPFNPDQAIRVLTEIQELLTAAGAQCFLAAGTLLGFHRSGGPLPHDRDIDIGVLREPGGGPDIAGILRKAPGVLLPRIARPGDRYFGLMHRGVAVDIFVHEPQDPHLVFGFSHTPGDIQWRVTSFGLRTASYGGHTWRVPADPERYLAELYGPAWQIPDPGFASAVSSPALHDTSLYARAFYAAMRAARAFSAGDRQKAAALMARSPVPLPPEDAQPAD